MDVFHRSIVHGSGEKKRGNISLLIIMLLKYNAKNNCTEKDFNIVLKLPQITFMD